MTTVIDSNIIAALMNPDDTLSRGSPRRRSTPCEPGQLVVPAPVFAELLAAPNRTEAFLDAFFLEAGITVEWNLDETDWRAAGRAFRAYAARRRKHSAEGPRQILTDFLIGAFALQHGFRLLTLDRRLYPGGVSWFKNCRSIRGRIKEEHRMKYLRYCIGDFTRGRGSGSNYAADSSSRSGASAVPASRAMCTSSVEPRQPEDMEVAPGGKHLIVSQFSTRDRSVAGLFLLDPRSRTFHKIEMSAEPAAGWGDPACPGPHRRRHGSARHFSYEANRRRVGAFCRQSPKTRIH